MKLRTIEIIGFKSFRDRVFLEISDGMTCIVGPNGCGKSNVVDAIKWAMGDMSPKSLRGDSMQDIIFAGTEKQKPGGMAEVTLTFENTDVEPPEPREENVDQEELLLEDDSEAAPEEEEEKRWEMGKSIPREFQDLSEIAITRRLHRSGESEYLINKVSCRLRDIRNLLAGTGLGKQGYSIIEQGQIGFIVNARPEDRRMIIEEASGITRYKDQRQRAERKLDRTEQNLQRTQDILDEIEKQLHILERQAKKAVEHRRLSEELQGLEIALLLAKRHEAVAARATHEKELTAAKEKEAEATNRQEKAAENLRNARVNAHQADRRHADLTESYYKVETRLNLSRSNKEHSEAAQVQAVERRGELDRDRKEQEERRKEFSLKLDEVKEQLGALKSKPDAEGEEVEHLERDLAELKSARQELVRRRDEARRTLEKQRGLRQRQADRSEWIDGQVRELEGRETANKKALEDAREDAQDLGRAVGRLELDHERAAEEITTEKQTLKKAEVSLNKMKSKLGEVVKNEKKWARKSVELSTRIESLEAMRKRGDGYAEGVRRVLKWAKKEGRDDIIGPAGDFLEVPEGREAAVAAYLGDRLGDIVVTSRESALEALAMLSAEDAGRIGCFPIAEEDGTPSSIIADWMEGLQIVDDLGEVPKTSPGADRMDGSGPRAWATGAGDMIFADGRVVGGGVGDKAETMLRQARELEELRREFEVVQKDHRELEEELSLLREDTVFSEDKVAASRDRLQEMSHRARGIEQERESEAREKERALGRMEKLKTEQVSLKERREKLIEEQQALAEQRKEIGDAIPEAQKTLESVSHELNLLDEKLEEINALVTEKKVRVAQVDERRRYLIESIDRFQDEIVLAGERMERFGAEIEEQKQREKDAQMRAETLSGQVAQLTKDHETISRELAETKTILKEATEQVESLELTVLVRRQDVDEFKEMVQKLQMAHRETELTMEHVAEQLMERFEIDLAEAQQVARNQDLPAPERKARVGFLKSRITRIGAVNPLAIEEFKETKERHEFHADQQADLESSVADLRDAIFRMDQESRKRFGETFKAVNAKFQEVFPRLFRGGMARLILTNEDDMLNTGVDIAVQPPGKALQNVTLLSGGEKALTAVSLIFSIFLLKPTPFSILDEVDAPLDDANVGRFAEMVRDLSQTSQMIVITHNRRTMEAPQRLYGVTMEEAGISKVVSVKLSEIDDRLAS